MPDIFSTPDDNGDIQASEVHSSLGEQVGAEFKNALDPQDSLSAAWIYRRAREGIAGGYAPHDWDGLPGQAGITLDGMADQARAQIPSLPIDQAKQRVKDAGLEGDVTLPEQAEVKQPVLDLMVQEAQERRNREAAISRGPQGFYPDALGTITSIGAGMLDPVNAAAFSIPVVGEARWGKIIEGAGDSIARRAALNAGRGAAQGAVGSAALQPADWWLHTQDGHDYTFADVLQQVALGAGMGAAAHAGFGAIGDVRARLRGEPLPGSPADLLARGQMSGIHVPGDALSEDGATDDHLAEILGLPRDVPPPTSPEGPAHPSELFGDLPPAAQQDALRVTMADMINGDLPQPMEMLQVAADHNPRIAESIDAWHGSPHDFDRFDISRIGTGEGAQSYGHGLYFAENEKVARGYQRATSEKAFVDKVAQLYDEGTSPDDAWAEIKDNWKDFSPQEQRLMAALEKDDWLGYDYPHQAVNAVLRSIKNYDVSPETAAAAKAMGNMYRVKINANHDHFLDWDVPLGEQSEHIRAKLRTAGFENHQTGKDIYHSLVKYRPDQGGASNSAGVRLSDLDATPKNASGKLSATGILGIKYLDAGSRHLADADAKAASQRVIQQIQDQINKGGHSEAELAKMRETQQAMREGAGVTRNFVVFGDKHIEITHKNGEPVKREEILQQLAAKPKTARGRAAADPQTWSLFEMLAHEGGLKPDSELEAIFGNKKGPFVPGFGALVRQGGRTLDDALRLAKDHGYLFDAADVTGAEGRLTPNDLLDRLAEENAGRRQYRHDEQFSTRAQDTVTQERERHEIISALHDELAAGAGSQHIKIDPGLEYRVVEIMTREGEHDVMAAYERAIMEDQERYNDEANQADRSADAVAQRNVPNDTGAAPPGGGTAAAASSDGGGGGSGPRPDARGQSRADRRGDRAAPQTQLDRLARDEAFARLGNRPPAYDAADEVENSRWADNLPEPASVDPKRSAGALQQAVAEAEQIWRDIEPYLSEDERRAFNDRLEAADRDAISNLQVLKDGAACLAAAVA